MESIRVKNWDVVTGCERLTPGCDSCPSFWEYKQKDWDFNAKFHSEKVKDPLKNPTPTKYTVALGSDLFHEAVTKENIKFIFDTMSLAHWHWFEICTKRPERMFCVSKDLEWGQNISLAVSVESQEYKWRIEYLRQSPAVIKCISMVPLLGPMGKLDLTGIAIVGVQAETWGLKRKMEPNWSDDIKLQCEEQGVIFSYNNTDIYSEGEVTCPAPE